METAEQNPLLAPFQLPRQAVPFDRLRNEHFIPALRVAIAEAQRNVAAIRASASEDFEGAVVALESAAERTGLIAGIFFNFLAARSDEALQAMARDVSPMLAAFSSDVSLDEALFAKIKNVYGRRKALALDAEQSRLLEKTYRDFVRNGALLASDEKAKLRALDQELSKLGPEFSDNVLKATNAYRLELSKPEEVEGLPHDALQAAAEAAKAAGASAAWLFTLQAPSYVPFMTYAARRDLRERMWRAYNSRAFGGPYDNQRLATEIARLRHERARLLGYSSHAAFTLEERMAETPERALSFLERLLDKSREAALRDVAEVSAFRDQSAPEEGALQPWDYAYWSEKLKRARYDFDQESLRAYFPLERVVAGAFEHARRLYGLRFDKTNSIPAYHPDVYVYEVTQEDDGSFVGLFYADFFPRESKRGGAWMTSFRDQGLFQGEVRRPHVAIVCNFTPPTGNKPSLLSFDEVRTLFHEFGHSLHGLLSDCTYPSLSGTSVYWDFVELPSQIMENWTLEKEALDLFARHWQTGERLPADLTAKIKRTAKFQAGFSSLRQLNFGLLDMAWHAADPSEIKDVAEFEARATQRTRALPAIAGTNLSCSFTHIFAGGYSAGYYSYKWAEVLDADAFEAFLERGLFDQGVARAFRDHILKRGGTEHPMTLYKRFRGREPDPDALLRRDGLI